ncbi:bifunctional alpha/beta hydrolase/OsmC family protein [Salaquimonas pukyongi]|uniref:bifunctional alpha/beta hydrolase/OsmC family protein n=1 Tax=Salaquimonas pukyongi TaxID=2712698 RepID=UPI00096BCE37|nr:bifunctional alpha/beta hydrolase/OsmC family protein [Salaquimonas pukyongi]
MESLRLEFAGASGATLAARLDLPLGPVSAYALFAHCFTCSKDLNATRRISASLAAEGIAVLRFDFTGLGKSGGEFASTNFSSNVADLVSAADFLRERYAAPSILIGHSLGGAAVLVAASSIPETEAVVTIGAPADAAHVTHNFAANLEKIETEGSAEVSLGGRKFTIQKQFLEDVSASSVQKHVKALKKPLLIFHSPIDQTVGIENAGDIFMAAKHPKSFVSLDTADHLLTRPDDAEFVASTIAAWAQRYVPQTPSAGETVDEAGITVTETGVGKFQNLVQSGRHHMFADEPKSYGGDDTGPSPYDYVAIGLAACTSMTLKMYADRKGWDISPVSVSVDHAKIHAVDCETCSEERKEEGGKIDRFHRTITLKPGIDEERVEALLVIADKCPVHRTLHASSEITTALAVKDGA